MEAAAQSASATTPVDRLQLAFLASAAVVAVLFVPSPGSVLLEIAALSAVILLACRVRSRSRWLALLHAFLPLVVLSLLINLIGPLIVSVNRPQSDAALAGIDAEWFAWLIGPWRNAFGRPEWLTDAASIAYASYYFLPIAAAAPLWKAGRTEEFDRLAFSMTAIVLACYVAYFIAPAYGPRVPDDLAQATIGGGTISALLRAFLRAAERNQLDAFPSGHTAVSLAFLAATWPAFPRLRPVLVLAVSAIIFSTVYLSLHYLIDVFAGVALALIVLPAVPFLRRLFAGPALVAPDRAQAREHAS